MWLFYLPALISCTTDTPPDKPPITYDTELIDTAPGDDTTPTHETGETGTTPPWNGQGAYRVIITVPALDPGDDGVDEGPAEVEIDFADALDQLGVDGQSDLRTLQVIREDAEGNPLTPSLAPAAPLGAYDLPYRIADKDLWSEGYAYNFAVRDSEVTLTFVHRQEGAGDTRYAVYFDTLGAGVDPATISPRPALGDMDMRHRSSGYLASMIHSRPHLVDLDQDGLLDIVMGDSVGRISLYRNEGSATEPVWRTGQMLHLSDGAPIQKNYLAIPEVVDWDGDGDLDLLVGSEHGAIITLYTNTGQAGVPVFEDAGTLQADGTELQLPFEPCPVSPFFTTDYTAAPEVVDWDGDGDLDLLAGGYVTGQIFLYENTGSGLTYAGPIEADGEIIDVGWAASPVLTDIDADGDLDLLSCLYVWDRTDEDILTLPPFYGWLNTAGPDAEPVFTAWELPLVNGDNLAAGALCHVGGGDVDSDGDTDLLVAAEGYAWLFRNTGTATDPGFEWEDPLTLPMDPLPVGADTQAIDVDGDGQLDLLSGGNMEVRWIANLGGGDPVEWASRGAITTDGEPIQYSFEGGDDTSFPVALDWENDGDLDLLIGTAEGWVDLYRGTGDMHVDGLGPVERLLLESGLELEVGEPMDPKGSFEGHSGNRAQPTAWDLDGDGDHDVLVGDALGGLTLFENTGDDSAPVFAEGEEILWVDGLRLAPSLADWDGDGDADLLLGQSDSVLIYENVGGPGDFVLGESETLYDPTVYYPHPHAVDWNGDGDLDLSISSSYGNIHLAERTWIEQGWIEAATVAVEARGGERADWVAVDPTEWAYEGDVRPSLADPAWTPFWTEGSVADGVLTLGSGDTILIGSIHSDLGDDAWPATTGTEVEIRLRVLSLDHGQTDAINLALTDGWDNWHLRWSDVDVSFYGHADRYVVDTLDWHTWRVVMGDGELTACMDDDPGLILSSPPSFSTARNALWIGDDGTGTGGTAEIDWVRWTSIGDGDPCTGW